MKKNLLLIILFIAVLTQPLLFIIDQREKFFSPGYHEKFASLKSAYNQSQYAKKKNPTIMSDADFEQFAGGAFLQGLNPILIVHDHPPLGRYIVSLSILLFDNPHLVMLPIMLFIAIGVYLLAKQVLENQFIAFIPLWLFVNGKIYLSKLIFTPLPEPIQLPFVLFAFYFFLKGLESKKDVYWFILTAVMLGGVISTRFFILGAAIAGTMGLYLLLTYRLQSKTLHFILTLPLSLVVLVASYFRTIQDGYSVIQIFSIQKYILAYHKSKFILPLSFWDLLLFNRWHTWWADRAILKDAQWTILWPIATVLTGGMMLLSLFRKFKGISQAEKVLMLWVLVHVTMLSTGYTSTRYFLPLIPILYILATAFMVKLFIQALGTSELSKRTSG